MKHTYPELESMALAIFKGGADTTEKLIALLSIANEMYDLDPERAKKVMIKVREISTEKLDEDIAFFDTYNEALKLLARRCKDFDSYMLFLEHKRDPEEMFYIPRRKHLLKLGLVQAMQRLLDDEIDVLSISMPPGTGKAGSLDSLVLTPDGFVKNRDLKIGDSVISGSGNVSTVLGIFPQGKKPLYDVIFNDGSKTRCSIDHLWTVQTRDDRNKKRHKTPKYRTIPLSEMLNNYRIEGDKRSNYSVDYVPAIDCFDSKELKIDPYLLGIILGDGSITCSTDVVIPDAEILYEVQQRIPDSLQVVHRDRYTFAISRKAKTGENELRTSLKEYGLFGKRSFEKHIPKDYLYSSYKDRLLLLQGLLDSDGYPGMTGIEYTTTSKQLAEDVCELVHSLSGYCSINHKEKTGYRKDGEYISCRPAYRLFIQFSAEHPNPFKLTRKATKYSPKRTIWKRFITDIIYVGEEECQCIYIDDESHLYITDDYIITHNTSLGEFFISFVMGLYPNTSNLMSSHSGYMTRMFYDAVQNIIQSNEYCWKDVFPKVALESTNAKEETINLGRWQPFKTLTCRPIRASLTGVTRCEGFLYCDDLVSGIEEALSKERLDKLYGEYTTDLKSRKKKNAKEIHIATRWSVHDVIGRLQRQYGDDKRSEFISVPDIDPKTGESNFDYDYDVGFDKEYFEDMANSMDDVSYRCLFKSDPIEREGLLYHPEELRRYLGGLPDKEPDAILALCDTKDTGADYNFLGVFYQYKDRYYLEDLVFKNIDPGTLDELNSTMLVKHQVQMCQFESNKEGSRTAIEVERLVKAKGGSCHITKKYSTQNKETKIIVNSSWVKEHIYFKDPTEYDPRSDYGIMISQLCSYTQLGKNIHDDAPDALAMFALYVNQLYSTQIEVVKRSDLGF